jgi:hypothetical protein
MTYRRALYSLVSVDSVSTAALTVQYRNSEVLLPSLFPAGPDELG